MKKEASWSHLELICKRDAACVETFRKVMRQELPLERGQLDAALKDDDTTMAANLVHKIKHKFSLVEMTTAYELAVMYEEALNKSDASNQAAFNLHLDELMEFLGI